MKLYRVVFKHRMGWTYSYINVKAESKDSAVSYCSGKILNSRYSSGYSFVSVEVMK